MKQNEHVTEIDEVRKYFDEFIFGFIFNDIQAAINGKANFLAALGLLCYTEFLGGLMRGEFRRGVEKKNFDTFFKKLGRGYVDFDEKCNKKECNVYDIYRCGMAHEYFIKKDFTIYMNAADKTRIGVGKEDGQYYFIVENYFRDFKTACARLYKESINNSKILDNIIGVIDSQNRKR